MDGQHVPPFQGAMRARCVVEVAGARIREHDEQEVNGNNTTELTGDDRACACATSWAARLDMAARCADGDVVVIDCAALLAAGADGAATAGSLSKWESRNSAKLGILGRDCGRDCEILPIHH